MVLITVVVKTQRLTFPADKVSRGRNEETKGIHSFLMQGEDPVCLLHKPSFHVANHRHQTIIEVELPQAARDWYSTLRFQYPGEIFIFKTVEDVDLTEAIQSRGSLTGFITSAAS